jgi:hypothetical protein|tara:strand:- start:236 stop:664 length:429 start_codon:yes stop_codon:yes gene_type:complete
MILISHRGNINGKDVENENNPLYIDRALGKGYDVEVDVWYKNSKWYLGHDKPQYEIELDYLRNKKLWCHAKNIEALNLMLGDDIHCFWHQEDDVTLTSCGFVWTYPGKKLTEKAICVLPEKNNEIPKKVLGICSDYIVSYKG